jgi:hypothetical protein
MEESNMHITETEHVALIREAVDGKHLALRFGAGWVLLEDVPENEWAIQRIKEMRAQEEE